MNRLSLALVALIMGCIVFFIVAGTYAETEVPNVIKLEEKAYEKHKEGIVVFSHKKHEEEYAKKHPEFFESGCGECHHDENNKPLVNLKPGDDVKRCIECHKKPDQPRKDYGQRCGYICIRAFCDYKEDNASSHE